jgi:hypothetical protein
LRAFDCKLRFTVQDYKEAARLRDSLRSFEEEEPVLRLRRLMRKAIEEERFEVFFSCIAVVPSKVNSKFTTLNFIKVGRGKDFLKTRQRIL